MTDRRLIAIGDIHGQLGLLVYLVEKRIAFNPQNDVLVFLGDYIDRGILSAGVISYVQALKNARPDSIVLLKGNHEDLADAFFADPSELNRLQWLHNGGDKTLVGFESLEEAGKILVPFVQSLLPYLRAEGHIFVHGGVPRGASPETALSRELLWNRNFENTTGCRIVCGHTPHAEVTRRPNNIIAVDTGAFNTGILSAYDVLNDQVYDARAGIAANAHCIGEDEPRMRKE